MLFFQFSNLIKMQKEDKIRIVNAEQSAAKLVAMTEDG